MFAHAERRRTAFRRGEFVGAEFGAFVRAVAEGLFLGFAASAEGIEFVLLKLDCNRRIACDFGFQCHGSVLGDLNGFYQSIGARFSQPFPRHRYSTVPLEFSSVPRMSGFALATETAMQPTKKATRNAPNRMA